MTLLDSRDIHSDSETQSRNRLLLGVLAAVVVTSLVLFGYSILRKRHQQRVLEAQVKPEVDPSEALGPPKAQILVDEPMIKGEARLLGGTVKNISNENLTNLTVNLELVRRKDGGTEKVSAPVDPSELASQQEGRYSVQIHAADYLTVKLAGLQSGTSPAIAFVAGAGQKRPPEKLEPKTIIVNRPSSTKGGFLNTPDTPGRVP